MVLTMIGDAQLRWQIRRVRIFFYFTVNNQSINIRIWLTIEIAGQYDRQRFFGHTMACEAIQFGE